MASNFRTSVETACRFLKKRGLILQREYHPDYTQVGAATLRGKNYLEIWKYYASKNLFDVRLQDFSLLQFQQNTARRSKKSDLHSSYSYIPCPYEAVPYRDYIEREFGAGFHHYGEHEDEYDNYLDNCEFKEHVAPARYDYAPSDYRGGEHPASHLHIGHANEIRIATRRLWMPHTFTMYVLRQYYQSVWRECLDSRELDSMKRVVRDKLDDVPSKFFTELDFCEHHLS